MIKFFGVVRWSSHNVFIVIRKEFAKYSQQTHHCELYITATSRYQVALSRRTNERRCACLLIIMSYLTDVKSFAHGGRIRSVSLLCNICSHVVKSMVYIRTSIAFLCCGVVLSPYLTRDGILIEDDLLIFEHDYIAMTEK